MSKISILFDFYYLAAYHSLILLKAHYHYQAHYIRSNWLKFFCQTIALLNWVKATFQIPAFYFYFSWILFSNFLLVLLFHQNFLAELCFLWNFLGAVLPALPIFCSPDFRISSGSARPAVCRRILRWVFCLICRKLVHWFINTIF